MAKIKPDHRRDKVITLKLDGREYAALIDAVLKSNARSMSDYIRGKLLRKGGTKTK
jgi:hypothetical protein